MTSEAIVGLVAALSALVGAFFTGRVALTHARREVATADVLELRAYREAWIWAVRTIVRLLAILGRNDIPEPEGIRDEMQEMQDGIDNPAAFARREAKK